MFSPPFTFILVLVALSCAALEKVHACSYPNPYTSLASQSEQPLCRRTLPESEIREKCKELCEATYPHLVILYEVGAHLMGECIKKCVSSSNDPNHPWHPFITASGAAALASSHDDNLHSPSPPRSHSPVAHGGASTPPPPHGDGETCESAH
ncbi:hypothetical protein F5887DRAFT_265095 [Amanita rubescens]|nr:hypothetical protein F5887DRAFT_265095 [Amanita rubescens]